VDLSLHSNGNRLLVFARKPAPVQVSYLGYASTTGVSAIDYRLTDPHIDPPGQTDGDYTEQLVRLPDTWWCYSPLADAPPVMPAPAASRGFVTFGCLNNFAKVTPAAIALWSRILLATPGSRLVLLAGVGEIQARAGRAFATLGIDPARLDFVNRQSFAGYLGTYHRIDIALDTMPFNGGTTTCDALWMGVPVITQAGCIGVSRVGRSLLNNLNLQELVAVDPDGYVDAAVSLAKDTVRLAALRASMRDRLRSSPLTDAARFARNVEASFRCMWNRWCQGDVASL
jgi:predicted O-linked N-acetylglucosamine transferase (SPINDLY family)